MILQKQCYRCEETKPLDAFVRRSGGKTNYRNICKICTNAIARKYSTSPERRALNTQRMREWMARPGNRAMATKRQLERNKRSPDTALRLMIFNARKRFKVDLTLDDLRSLWESQKGKCALTGIEMTWGRGRIMPTSMSLDRINPLLAYTPDNVRLLCHAVNSFKGRSTDSEMLSMARAIVDRAPQPWWSLDDGRNFSLQ